MKIRKLIVEQKIDPNKKMPQWFDSEPLGWQASFGQLRAVYELCRLGQNPMRPQNKAGVTPLTDQVRENHQSVVDFFSEYKVVMLQDEKYNEDEQEQECASKCKADDFCCNDHTVGRINI